MPVPRHFVELLAAAGAHQREALLQDVAHKHAGLVVPTLVDLVAGCWDQGLAERLLDICGMMAASAPFMPEMAMHRLVWCGGERRVSRGHDAKCRACMHALVFGCRPAACVKRTAETRAHVPLGARWVVPVHMRAVGLGGAVGPRALRALRAMQQVGK